MVPMDFQLENTIKTQSASLGCVGKQAGWLLSQSKKVVL